ncbi:MAG: hypothetical protein EAZ97_09920 [Bacteroidetes bacterium]|nr:MAG: hypothetical protein EAZ97_09920 [Bacteroidota bacterium]
MLTLFIEGTDQTTRISQMLDLTSIQPDDLTFEKRLVFASKFGAAIHFYDLKNEINGDWQPFFSADESVIIAKIMDFDINEHESNFRKIIYQLKATNEIQKKIDLIEQSFEKIAFVLEKISFWLKNLHIHRNQQLEKIGVREEIMGTIQANLLEISSKFKVYYEFAVEKFGIKTKINFKEFDLVWKFDQNFENDFEKETEKEQIEDLTDFLNDVFSAFYEMFVFFKRKAKDFLQNSLEENRHQPHLAMYFTFLKLYEKAQKNINKFTERHLNFYYRDILRQDQLPANYDKLFLTFELNEDREGLLIKKDTAFIFKEDELGKEITYTTNEDLVVTKAQIQQIKTLFVRKTPLKNQNTQIVTHIYANEIPADYYKLGTRPKTSKTWATFGEDQNGLGKQSRTMFDAQIGFMMASPNLFLKEGAREISIHLQFSQSSYKNLQHYLHDISETTGDGEEEVFIKTFLEAYLIKITTENAWLNVKRYSISKDEAKNSLTIRFDLSSSDPAIVAYNSEVHGFDLKTALPCVQLCLSNDSYVYAYSLLQKLELKQVTIDVQVKGVKKLLLYNNLGQLSADSPFLPFGPTPTIGSYLIVGSNEIFQKTIKDLSINIEWFDLPRHPLGFFGHYQGYKANYDNLSFEVALTILNGGKWKPEDDNFPQYFTLFRTVGQKDDEPKSRGRLSKYSRLDRIRINKILLPPNDPEITKELVYSTISQRGFIRLELINPEKGVFGHEEYPIVLSKVSIENAQKKPFLGRFSGIVEDKPLPKTPYSPTIKDISLDYASSYIIPIQDQNLTAEPEMQAKFFHIQPFGVHQVYPSKEIRQVFLLPEFDFEGAMLLGISDLNPLEPLNILFELIDEYSISSDAQTPVTEWGYLSNNRWFTLKNTQLLSDTTNHFLKSGIAILNMPEDINPDNSILDPKLSWIRIVVKKNNSEVSRAMTVHTQAVQACLKENGNTDTHLQEPIPPFTINRSVENLIGVRNIYQPLPSFDGKPMETPQNFYIRISERLRHKQRAVTIWDYERLVLSNFPIIFKVKCLPNQSSVNRNGLQAGQVMIVVIGDPKMVANPYEPMVSNETLYQIKVFLEKCSSTFIKLEVRNPSFERVKIQAAVKFSAGCNNGFYVQKLQDEINSYLCNWLPPYHKGASLGGGLALSDMATFIQERTYVDFVTKLSILQIARDSEGNFSLSNVIEKSSLVDTAEKDNKREVIKASKPWAVLVPALEHSIEMIGERIEILPTQAGIQDLAVETDFVVG